MLLWPAPAHLVEAAESCLVLVKRKGCHGKMGEFHFSTSERELWVVYVHIYICIYIYVCKISIHARIHISMYIYIHACMYTHYHQEQ